MGRIVVVVGFVALLALGSSSSVHAQSDGPTTQASVKLPPELDRVLRDYEKHWSAGEADALAALFVEDGLIVRDGTWIRGRPAIRDAYRDASGPLKLRAIEYAAEGELGYIVGAYGYGDDLPVEDRGLFVLTLRRDGDGPWRIVSDMDRSGSG